MDIAIIGAGAAGLAAAKEASLRGLSVTVLEASSSIGGRARTDHESLGMPFDLGCHWLQGGEANPFRETARSTGARIGLPLDRHSFHDGKSFCSPGDNDDANRSFEGFETKIADESRKLTETGGEDRSAGSVIDTDNKWAGHFLRMLQHECAADPHEVSLADPALTVFGSGDVPVLTGYGDLIRQAARGVSAKLDCAVSSIDLAGRRIVLVTTQGQVEARTVVVTASTSVLAAGRIALKPNGWPDAKLKAIDAVPTGSSTKVGLRFAAGSLQSRINEIKLDHRQDMIVQCTPPEPQNVFWHLGTGDGDMAIAYLGGSFSRELALAGEAEQISWAKSHLEALLGNSIDRDIVASCVTPFDRDPWIGGGYSYCKFGSGNQRLLLAQPIDDRVFFAGEAYSSEYPSTAHGAWLSGRAAVQQISALVK